MAEWQKPEIIAIWIWVVIFFFLILVMVNVILVRNYVKQIQKQERKNADLKLEAQKQLLQRSIDIQEEERNRIAGDLHDNLVSQLNILRLLYINGQHDSIKEKIVSAMQTARRISHDLTPPFFEMMELQDLLEEQIADLKSEFEINYYTQIFYDLKLEKTHKLQLFRVFQEVINNIIKHAKATHLEIYLRITETNLQLKIEDNGVGFQQESTGGIGLKNINSRVELLNGKSKMKSELNKGTIFILNINHETF
ncbi:sensor histidine kinase [Aureivirga marina]|uniref:sensor histidine kinase n=1 Tax=Aureivirga marina TaxID=1182451 RepID=UPI0018CAD396|nr:ATP-binding protein [Aureivirga marina]